MSLCNGQVLVESEVKKEETTSRDCLVQFVLYSLKKHLPFSQGHTCISFQFSDAIVSHDNVDNF